MHPIAFELFGRPIYWFGVMMALGFLGAISLWNWLAPRSGRPAGYGSELGFCIMISGVVGARIAEVVTNWPHYAAQPLEIIRVDRGGLVYYGGFILACLAVIVFARRHRDPLWSLADFAVVGLPLGHGLGRIGCFINGCCYGLHTDLPWAVHFPADHESHGAAVHPTQLFEAGYNFLLFGVLLAYFLRRRPPAGRVFALYLLLYPPFRFLVECIREEPHGAFGLTSAQQASIPLFLIGLVLWWWRGRKNESVYRPT